MTNKLKRSVSRFKDVAYSGTFRADGKLMVAGGEAKMVQIFDLNSRAILRQFTGHTRAVHSTLFSPSGTSVASFSDDRTVRRWDLASEKELSLLEGHEDYIRTGVFAHGADHLILSGSYDHTVRLWDTRASSTAPVVSVDHGAPVESVLMFPSGSMFVTAGGNRIKVWDALGRSRMLHSFSNHQKTITSLCFDANAGRLLSGSLDRQVKVYDVKDYKVVHSMKYSGPISSLALSPNSTHLAVGTVTGVLSIRRRPTVKGGKVAGVKDSSSNQGAGAAIGGFGAAARKRQPKAGTFKFFVRGHDHKALPEDYQAAVDKKKRLKSYDKLIKKFKYHDALDLIMRGGHRPVLVISVLHELVQRSALKQALAGRDQGSLKPILAFINKHITNPRYSSLLLDVAALVIDLYGAVMGQSPAIDECFVKLALKLKAEVAFQERLFELMGSMDLLLSSREKLAA